MPHDIGTAPKHIYKKGDKVQHNASGQFATVAEDQTDPLIVKIKWDERSEGPQDYRSDAFSVAPWHGINVKEYVPLDAEDWKQIGFVLQLHLVPDADLKFTDAGSLGGAVKAKKKLQPLFKKGDRVKLKYNRKCGTVHKDQTDFESSVCILWDHRADTLWEMADDLVVLHAPRDTDPVNPNQEAIDAIEVQRQVLIKEVNAVQARLRSLTTAKRLLERG
jgi:hypothetical protein